MQCRMVAMLFVALLVQCMLGHVSPLIYFEMFPKSDQFILVGARFQLNCTMKQFPDSADVPEDYQVNKTKILKGTQELPADVSSMFYQEDRTLAVIITNVTLEHAGSYMCYYGNDSTIQTFKPVHVGEPPGKPENIMCVSNNLNDFRCSFTLSKQPTNIPMRWFMQYRLPDDRGNATVNCSTTSDLVISCEPCPLTVVIFASHEILINGVNDDFELQVNESFTVILNQSIVRPDPVATLQVELTNVSSESKLLWGFPRGLLIFAMQYKIVITSDWDNRTLYKEGNQKHEEYLLTKLVRFTKYRVTVQAKPVEAVRDIYWSTKSVMDFWTASDICKHTVSVTPGSYMRVDREEEMGVVLYWKNPAREDWNGNITGYGVVVQPVKLTEYNIAMANNREERNLEDQPIYRFRRVTKPWLENLTGIAVSGALTMRLNKMKNYSMKIMVINTAGISMNYNEIVIPNWDKGETLKVQWVAVEMASSSVHISWGMDPKNCHAVRSVTYYRGLVDTNSSVMNEYPAYKEIDWVTFDISDGCGMQTSHQIEKVLYQSNARYAVSVGTGQISGGMVSETFRFNKHDDVADMPRYTVAADQDRLQVHILYSDYYVSEGGRPQQYQIVYSEDSESDDCPLGGDKITFPADFTNPVFEINDLNLKSGAQYKVCVAAINTAGIGRYGKPVIAKTPEDNTATIMILVIVGIVTVILLVVFVIWCFMCRRRFQKYKIENQTITEPIPDGIKMDYLYIENDARKTSVNKLSDDHDSGKGSDSPASSSSEINQLQQDGVRVSPKNSSCNVSTVSTEDGVHGSDTSRKRKVSPALFGYLKAVQGNSSNSVYVVECSDQENDSLIDGKDISGERNGAFKNSRKRIYGDLSCSSNSDEDLNVTKAITNTNAISTAGTAQVPGRTGGSRERNEYDDDTQMQRNINNIVGNALVPNTNEYLPNGNDQEIHRFISGVTNYTQETPNNNLVYVDEHGTRKVPANVKAYVLNDAEKLKKMFPKQSHFYMEDAVSDKPEIKQNSIADNININEDVFNVNLRQSDAAEVQLNDSQLEEKTDENVETTSVNSRKLIQENSLGVMNSDQQSKGNLKDKARLPNRELKQEAIDTNNDALQPYASHDYQTHSNCKVKADEDIISNSVEANTSDDMDTFAYDRDIISEEIKDRAAQGAVITDFVNNPSTEETSDGKVNTEYNGGFVNGVNRSSEDPISSYNDEDIFSNTFDNLIGISNISHYRNPDEISLGQGSTISDDSDTTSIESYEFMNGRRSGTLSPGEVETPILKVCKENQEFVEVENVVYEGNGDKIEVECGVENDKKIEEEFKHTEVGAHIEKSKVKCSVQSGDSEHGEMSSSESSKNTSGTGNVVSYMKTGLENATDGIQEFNLKNTEITDRKAREDNSLKNASSVYAGNALDSNSAIRNNIQNTPL